MPRIWWEHYWQPSLVLIDTQTLLTLPDREFRSGLAEVIKYGVILDAALFDQLENCPEALVARDAAASSASDCPLL